MKPKYVFEEIVSRGQIDGFLSNKDILVFGGSGGIGKSICESLIRAGANVTVAGRNHEKLDFLSRKIPSISVEVCDVLDAQQIEGLLNRIAEKKLPDVIINCVGIFQNNDKKRNILATTENDWDVTFNTNFMSNLLILDKYDGMVGCKNVYGKYIGVSSIDGIRTAVTAYGLSKVCLNSFLKEYADNSTNTTIYVIAPGPTATTMMSTDREISLYRTDHPDMRCAIPQDIGNLAVMLAADDCHVESGRLIKCDGGYTL